VLYPLYPPVLTPLCNRVLVRKWGIRHLALANFILARPMPPTTVATPEPRVSVIVPARNEAGSVPAIFSRSPDQAPVWILLIAVTASGGGVVISDLRREYNTSHDNLQYGHRVISLYWPAEPDEGAVTSFGEDLNTRARSRA
jgi:hypothetical protein